MNNKTFFLQNVNALSKKNPDLARKVEKTDWKPHYKLIRSKTDHLNVVVERESGLLSLYNNDNPMKYTQKYLEGLNLKYAPYVVFLGLGLGYHLDRFFKVLSDRLETKEIIIFEKDIRLFRLALEVGDFRDILSHPSIHFFVGDDPNESFIKLRTDILMRQIYELRSLKIVPLPECIMLDDGYYLKVMETVKRACIQVMILVGNDSFDALIGLENMLENLNVIFTNPGINRLYKKFQNKPGILVAAGPSLNKDMHLLRGLRDKALIMSCDSTLIPLIKNGIRPHLVSSLERTPGTELYYSGIENFDGIYFIAIPVLMPETIEAFGGKKFVAYREYSHFDWLENEKGSLIVGQSIANLAFKVLDELGCDPIILVGQDLAYGKEGDTHVKGNVFGTHEETLLSKPVIELEGNDGTMVKSEKSWEVMKLTYEVDIADYAGTCINASRGAKIGGAKIMRLAEAINKYCSESFNPQTILDKVYDDNIDTLSPDKELERISLKAKDTLDIVEKTIDNFQEALGEARAVEEDIIQPFLDDNPDVDVDMDRLLSIEKKWLVLTETLGADKKLFDITTQTVQAYDIWLASELAFLKNIYSNKEILSMARVRKMTEWFAVVASFLVHTRDVLRKTDKILTGRSKCGLSAT